MDTETKEATTFERLLETLIQRFRKTGFPVPTEMTAKARELFVFYALEHLAIVPVDTLKDLLEAAHRIVHKWEQMDVHAGMRRLAVAVSTTTRCIEGEPLHQKVFIICKHGEVREVVGLDIDAYEVCDCGIFEGSEEREAEEYFDNFSEALKRYLRTTHWNEELPNSRRSDSPGFDC
jgi:hypothetical protein